MRRSDALSIFVFALSVAAPVVAQVPTNPDAEPPRRGWFDLMQFARNTRLRFTGNGRDATSTRQQQHEHAIRAGFNIDPQKRFTINAGSISIRVPVLTSFYFTAAHNDRHTVAIDRRFDAVVEYDFLNSPRKAGVS